MKRLILWIAGGVIVVLLLALSQLQSPEPSDPLSELAQLQGPAYAQAVAAHRHAKDQDFKSGKASPLPKEIREGFQGLAYYPVAEAWRLTAQWQPEEAAEPVQGLRGAGRLHARVAGQPLVLSAYWEEGTDAGPRRLFVPFRDSTSAQETYGGGRYLTAALPPQGVAGAQLVLDFNLAYNPYCVYSPDYLCPLPPAGNRVMAAVRAGERLPEAAYTPGP